MSKEWNFTRWLAVGIYLGISILLVLMLFLLPENVDTVGMILTAWTILALIPLFAILLRSPHGIREPEMDDIRDIVQPRKPDVDLVSDHIPLTKIVFIIVGIMVLIMAPLVAMPLFLGDIPLMEFALVQSGTVLFIGILLIFFHALDVEADDSSLRFHWGPFGKKISLSSIRSIRPVSVHPMKDYMGFGIRAGHEGDIGYISDSRFGIRVVTGEGKTYTVSTNRPMEICEMVRYNSKIDKVTDR